VLPSPSCGGQSTESENFPTRLDPDTVLVRSLATCLCTREETGVLNRSQYARPMTHMTRPGIESSMRTYPLITTPRHHRITILLADYRPAVSSVQVGANHQQTTRTAASVVRISRNGCKILASYASCTGDTQEADAQLSSLITPASVLICADSYMDLNGSLHLHWAIFGHAETMATTRCRAA